MGTFNADAIEIGAGDLQVTPYNDSGVSLTPFYVGGTSGSELAVTQEVLDVEIDQAFAPVAGFLIGESGTFKVTVMEQQMNTIAVALGLLPDTEIYSQPTYERITFGGVGKARYCKLYYEVTKTVGTGKWKITLWRCRCESGLALPFQKKEARKFELTFKIYASTANNNTLGYVERDRA
jgi:hypothetical protein